MKPPSAVDWIFWTLTVYLEAEGEPARGKLAVAWVIRNRAGRSGRSIVDVCLAPRQFSCWDAGPRRLVLDALNPAAMAESLIAVAQAGAELAADPTGGATHYLNPEVVLEASRELPAWAHAPGNPAELDERAVRARIGRHVFLEVA